MGEAKRRKNTKSGRKSFRVKLGKMTELKNHNIEMIGGKLIWSSYSKEVALSFVNLINNAQLPKTKHESFFDWLMKADIDWVPAHLVLVFVNGQSILTRDSLVIQKQQGIKLQDIDRVPIPVWLRWANENQNNSASPHDLNATAQRQLYAKIEQAWRP